MTLEEGQRRHGHGLDGGAATILFDIVLLNPKMLNGTTWRYLLIPEVQTMHFLYRHGSVKVSSTVLTTMVHQAVQDGIHMPALRLTVQNRPWAGRIGLFSQPQRQQHSTDMFSCSIV